MDGQDISYCGLDCNLCKNRFADIREKIQTLETALELVNFKEIVKVIPFMGLNYFGYKNLTSFFKQECPGCRKNGGNPFCGIRKCAKKKGYTTCAECGSLCKKFNMLFKIHSDNEIQKNITHIKNNRI
jgi:hypothetical protein